MQHDTKQVIDGFPGLKDMPVLGALFRSRDFQNDETELVVLVSAYLVNPTTESAFAAPTDGFVAPTDPETLLLGRLNAVYKKDRQAADARGRGPGRLCRALGGHDDEMTRILFRGLCLAAVLMAGSCATPCTDDATHLRGWRRQSSHHGRTLLSVA